MCTKFKVSKSGSFQGSELQPDIRVSLREASAPEEMISFQQLQYKTL